MKLPGPAFPQRHLRPGELLITQEPQWIITLLGSCVAVTMFSARCRVAAICHAMLPRHRERERPAASHSQRFRYLSHAIPAMVEPFARLHLPPEEVEVKVFGGGNVIDLGGDPPEDHLIGSTNIAMARELLAAARFRIKAQSVGGSRGCKILFNTHTGEVLHKFLSGSARPAGCAPHCHA
jgi:chemotaxis protein CheD